MNVFLYFLKKRGNIVQKTKDCIHCGNCQKSCRFKAVIMDKINKRWLIDYDKCWRCKKCIKHCPQRALKLMKNNDI
jgi:formate hydrogenlyase subunit 6/NADH:ubiquinone oxidoreductase subunit I